MLAETLLLGLALDRQQRQHRGAADDEGGDAGDGGRGAWTACVLKVLSAVSSRLAAAQPCEHAAATSALMLNVLEQLLQGGGLLGTSAGVVSLCWSQLAQTLLRGGGSIQLEAARRVLVAAAASHELAKHAPLFSAAVIDVLSALSASREAIDVLAPGVFALFDRCRLKQRQQIFASLGAQGRDLYADLNSSYLRDFKFKG